MPGEPSSNANAKARNRELLLDTVESAEINSFDSALCARFVCQIARHVRAVDCSALAFAPTFQCL